MITIVATFAVPEANRERFVELGRRLVAGSLAEVGNVSYQFVVSREDAGAFAFVEGWADAAAIDAHNASEHGQVYRKSRDAGYTRNYESMYKQLKKLKNYEKPKKIS